MQEQAFWSVTFIFCRDFFNPPKPMQYAMSTHPILRLFNSSLIRLLRNTHTLLIILILYVSWNKFVKLAQALENG